MSDRNKCLRKDIFGQCVIVNEIIGDLTPSYTPKPGPKPTPSGPTPPGPTPSGPTLSRYQAKVNGVLSNEDVVKAKVLKASKIYGDEGYSEAQNYLDNEKINLAIDPELSNEKTLVVLDELGNTQVAFRGSKFNTSTGMELNDLRTNTNFALGKEQFDKQLLSSRDIVKLTEEKYGAKPVELLGYSKGGGIAITLGDELSIHTTALNPFISSNHIKNTPIRLLTGEKVNHNIIRTLNDPASIGLSITPRNWNVKTIAELEDSSNPLENHSLDNFTDNLGSRYGNEHKISTKMRDVYSAGKKLNEHIIQLEMSQDLKEGNSFSDFLKRVSPPDIDERGNISKRTQQFQELWKEEGGLFTDTELEKLSEANSTYVEFGDNQSMKVSKQPPLATSKEERADFRKMNEAQKIYHTNESLVNELNNKSEDLDKLVSEHTKVSKSIIKDAVGDALNPTSLAGGLAAGIVGASLADKIDTQGELHPLAHTALTGSIIGGVQETGSTLLSSGVKGLSGGAFASGLATEMPALAGGMVAGELVKKGTELGLEKVGANKDVQGGVGSSVGGATTMVSSMVGSKALRQVGTKIAQKSVQTAITTAAPEIEMGAVEAGGGFLEAVGSGVVAGEEFGGLEAAPETGGLSLIAGAGIGAVVGALGFLGGKLFGG